MIYYCSYEAYYDLTGYRVKVLLMAVLKNRRSAKISSHSGDEKTLSFS